jgi:hypothetical protein
VLPDGSTIVDVKYPFRPKSNRHLSPGQFWAVPLSDGRFACGRVMDPTSPIAPRAMFVAGLMDWVGDAAPTEQDLVGRRVLAQGHAHIKAITELGGEVLGCRELESDGLRVDPADDSMSTWGFNYLARLAEHRLP